MYNVPYILSTSLSEPFCLITSDKDLEIFKTINYMNYNPEICKHPVLLFAGIPRHAGADLCNILFDECNPNRLSCFVMGRIYEESKSNSLYARLRNNKDKIVYIYEITSWTNYE